MEFNGSNQRSRQISEEGGEQGQIREPLLEIDQKSSEPPRGRTSSRLLEKICRKAKQPLQVLNPVIPSPQFGNGGAGSVTLLTALFALVAYLVVGVVSFSLLGEELQGSTTSTIVDALYFAIVTMTTVGYGDIVPDSARAKLFTCVFVFMGFGLVGVLVSGAANYLVEKQERLLVQKFHTKNITQEGSEGFVPDNEVVAAHWKAGISGVAVLIFSVAGLLVLIHFEGMSFINALYCVCVTVTTLGYGDQSFHTQAGRLFSVFWIMLSVVCCGQFFLYLAESRTEERQRQIAIWALNRPITPSDLEAADIDGNGVVSAAEFALYKLKEIGKIQEEDVLEVLKEFRSFDVGNTDTLNLSDIHVPSSAK